VQQCAAHNVAVELNTLARRSHLQGFSQWLRKHACFVSSIKADVPNWKFLTRAGVFESLDPEQWRSHFQVMEEMLLQALQLAAEPANTDVLPSSAAAAAVPEQQGLQFSSFSTGLPGADLLAALPAHSLTKLELNYADNSAVDCSALSAALARLSNLRQLSITADHDNQLSGSCLSDVQQLSCLTSFKLACEWSEFHKHLQTILDAPQLQQLQQLDLIDLGFPVFGGLVLSRLMQLTELGVDELVSMGDHIQLPLQLQRLQLGPCDGPSSYTKILQLKQLQHLSLQVSDDSSDQLLQVGQLPALEHLALLYHEPEVAAAAAPVWPRLKQLRVLQLDLDDDSISSRQLAVMLDGVAACSGVTKLMVKFSSPDSTSSSSSSSSEEEDEDASSDVGDGNGSVAAAEGGGSSGGSAQHRSLDVFATAAGLPGLRDLCINTYGDSIVPGDALALTALTGLTRLVLERCNASVGDLEATAIAYSCKQLRHLGLQRCALGSMACLAVVVDLQHLQELRLEGSGRVTVRGLNLLTQLQDLQQLRVALNDEVTAGVIQSISSAH
jgi:hypothetical protein